ncbi:MAG: carbohydrate kinase family protein [Candidatus Campbellbacteria bacterium]|nr:carbohydrate kinase family protein [Candidatus Campbellbacteria bacterium]
MEEEPKALDFVAVGDIVTDSFIDLKDVRIDKEKDEGDHGYDEICFRFGDKIPYEDVEVVPAVGNSPNAAVSASRLGLNTGLITNVGDDIYGKQDLEQLRSESIDLSNVEVHEGERSNLHYVLQFGAERTILVNHQQYNYKFPELDPAPKYLYLSSLAENSLPYHEEIADYLEKHSETKLAFQPGTFQMKLGYEKLKRLYELSELFFCNKQEAQRILETKEDDIKELAKIMHEHGPNIAVITDGVNGAYAFDGNEMWHMPMYPDPKPPIDRTGAGDSFSSTFTAAMATGKSIPEALEWGPVNSMAVVQDIGAQAGLLSREKLLEHLENRPEDYQPSKLE